MGLHRTPLEAVNAFRDLHPKGQVVLVMQGGGALGAYQGGVYEALHEAGVEPDWVIGTSIGAINGAIICGNPIERRLDRVKEFWSRVQNTSFWAGIPFWSDLADKITSLNSLTNGIPGFYESCANAFKSPEHAGCYSTAPLRKTLTELVDIDLINAAKPRLKVGAAQVRTSLMHYFDSRDMKLTLDHIMASGALPPAFPPVRIDGELYWDGGVLSNSPTEAIFDDNPRRDCLIFAVNMWHPVGPEPKSLLDVVDRYKDIQFSSRMPNQILRQLETHRLRHIISELSKRLPAEVRGEPAVREMAAYGCYTQMHVMQLLAPRLETENHMKELDFSAAGIAARWNAGRTDTREALAQTPWIGEFSPLEGVIVHQVRPANTNVPGGAMLTDAAE